jgi:hypothetical protein
MYLRFPAADFSTANMRGSMDHMGGKKSLSCGSVCTPSSFRKDHSTTAMIQYANTSRNTSHIKRGIVQKSLKTWIGK